MDMFNFDALLEMVVAWVTDVHDRFDREMEQALRNNRWNDAKEKLAGKDACQRIVREIQARSAAVRDSQHILVETAGRMKGR